MYSGTTEILHKATVTLSRPNLEDIVWEVLLFLGMTSPTRGRDVILSIAKGFDIDTDDISHAYVNDLISLKRHDSEMLKFVKLSRELERKLKLHVFPVAPFVVRSKIGRQQRQVILNRLTSQHIVCLLQRKGGSRSVEDIQGNLGENMGIVELARQKAVEQEAQGFKACHTNQEYRTKCMNLTAIDWYKEMISSSAAPIHKHKHKGDINETETEISRNLTKDGKRKAETSLLIDSDIDWEDGVRDSDARKFGFKKRLKPVVLELIDEAIPNSIAPELKVALVNEIITGAEKCIDDARNVSAEKIKEKLKPIVREATQAISHSQSIYYTT